jgi:hypothetical protein
MVDRNKLVYPVSVSRTNDVNNLGLPKLTKAIPASLTILVVFGLVYLLK